VTKLILVSIVVLSWQKNYIYWWTRHDTTQHNAMGSSKVQRLSGMQKQVLSLYRGFLRAARSKSEEERCKIESIISQEFRRNAEDVDRKNFLYIEYLLRRGNKQLDQLKNPGTTGLSSLQLHYSHPSSKG